MSDECKDFISKVRLTNYLIIFQLLEKDPANRLGTKNGLEEILSHDFFKSLDFTQLLSK